MGGGSNTTEPYVPPVAAATARVPADPVSRNEGNGADTSGSIARRRRATGLNDTFMQAFSDVSTGSKKTLGG